MPDEPTEPRWVPVVALEALPLHALMQVAVAGTQLVLAHAPEGLFACQAKAAEAVIERQALALGAPLSRMGVEFDAWLEGGRLVCPRHLASFALTDGAVSAGWLTPKLQVYPVRVADGAIEVDEAAVLRAPPFRKTTTWDLTARRT